ncbi:hypothetical protein PV325_009623, partial [Microctonus aethiopoides]
MQALKACNFRFHCGGQRATVKPLDKPRKEEEATATVVDSTGDLTAVRLKIRIGNEDMEVVAGAVNLPYDSPQPPPTPELTRLVDRMRNERSGLLVGSDSEQIIMDSSSEPGPSSATEQYKGKKRK